ncbi:MAG: PCI domain-containing protein [Candidatus Thorarchaeota archaeon]
MTDSSSVEHIQRKISDLDLDYMRGLVSEEEYNSRMEKLQQELEKAGGKPSGLSAAREAEAPLRPHPETEPTKQKGEITTDSVTAVKRTVQKFRRISIERIAQEAGVSAINTAKILTDLLDGRELSGRIDREGGDLLLGTGSGPAPKNIVVCPFCGRKMEKIAVRGEEVTCNMCRESFIIS